MPDIKETLVDPRVSWAEASYVGSDGSLWHIVCDPPPVPTKLYDWHAIHDDFDGSPDAKDDRALYAPTKEAAVAAVEQWVEEKDD
jgi:hypothetical protein